ncbi:hypothetical protein F2Q69_00019831 [Brassica cretica]|uniref:Uncharacterized protein n=1 Tax=Brassica cretica TaxID=69181 RepID=A0A8S9Q4S1_BRACR|nr:hypothetical protein F2Q69_00019831 [Brassica cretica]
MRMCIKEDKKRRGGKANHHPKPSHLIPPEIHVITGAGVMPQTEACIIHPWAFPFVGLAMIQEASRIN